MNQSTNQGQKLLTSATARAMVVAGASLAAALLGGCAQGGEAEGSADARSEELEATTSSVTRVWACVSGANLKIGSREIDAVIQLGGYLGRCRIYGDRRQLGDGDITTFATFPEAEEAGEPTSIGVQFQRKALNNLAPGNDGASCYDVDGDGELDSKTECFGGLHRSIDLPRSVQAVTPIKWVGINWLSDGHVPVGIYDVGHFDFHFYIQPEVDVNFIRPGPCNLLVNCDDEVKANKPIPPQYLPAGYTSTGLVGARMGGHLINFARAPEFTPQGGLGGGSAAFTSTLLYGQYDGHITFIEPMIHMQYLLSLPSRCGDIDQPAAFEVGGYYPRRYCVKYSAPRKEFTITLESFAKQTAG